MKPVELNEVTQRLIADASCGPGEHVRRFVRARAADPARLSVIQRSVRDQMDGKTIGYFSKALVYGVRLGPMRAAAFASLVKGGVLVVTEDLASESARYRLEKVPPDGPASDGIVIVDGRGPALRAARSRGYY